MAWAIEKPWSEFLEWAAGIFEEGTERRHFRRTDYLSRRAPSAPLAAGDDLGCRESFFFRCPAGILFFKQMADDLPVERDILEKKELVVFKGTAKEPGTRRSPVVN